MTPLSSTIYAGRVVHKRLTPKPHAFSYRVFAMALDVDEIAQVARQLRGFGYNRRAVVSFYDSDCGRSDGRPIALHIRATLRDAGLERASARIVLMCYPRLFGFVFNPLSVYFCHDCDDRLGAIVYEVSNTFGERTSYVIPVDDTDAGLVRQTCAKRMFVSPFTGRTGQYVFHVSPLGDEVVVGITFRDAGGPVLKTYFRAHRLALTDLKLAGAVVRNPLMTVKVIAGIHFEAMRLWLKRVPVVARHVSPAYSLVVVRPNEKFTADA
jgi:uncharacterized protein